MVQREVTDPDEGRRPPPRPPLGSDIAPPAPAVLSPAPATVRGATWCWAAAALAGVVAVAAVAADLDPLRTRLLDAARAADPGAAEELLRSGADTALAGVLVATAVLVLLGLGALLLLRRRRGGWRRVLVVLGLLAAGVGVLGQDVVSGGPEVDRIAFLVLSASALLTSVLLLARRSAGWARERR